VIGMGEMFCDAGLEPECAICGKADADAWEYTNEDGGRPVHEGCSHRAVPVLFGEWREAA
jgi:hypothetical protein